MITCCIGGNAATAPPMTAGVFVPSSFVQAPARHDQVAGAGCGAPRCGGMSPISAITEAEFESQAVPKGALNILSVPVDGPDDVACFQSCMPSQVHVPLPLRSRK